MTASKNSGTSRTMLKKLKSFFFQKKVRYTKFYSKQTISRELLFQLSELDSESPTSAYLTFAMLLKERGEYNKSLQILEKLKKRELSEEEKKLVFLNLALVYKAAGFLDRAEEAIKEGINNFPSESLFYYQLAQIYKISGKLPEAVSYLEKAVELNKNLEQELIHTRLYLANLYIEKGRTDKAFRIIRKTKLTLPLPLFYYVISKLFYSVGENEKGFKKAVQGMKLSPKHTPAFINMIEEFENLNEDKLKHIIGETRLSPYTGKLLVEELLKKGNYEEALKILSETNKKFPYDPEIKELYLKLLWERGKRKQVVEEIASFLRILKEKKRLFKCENCGYETNTFDWICPRCREWETLEMNCEEG